MLGSIFGNYETRGRSSGRFLASGAALILIAIASARGLAAQTLGPVILVDGTEYDFGQVFSGESLLHAFTVQNTGAAPLELSQKISRNGRPALVYAAYVPQ